MIRVGVNGYGVIGKRVAHAITLQDDMKLVGITKTKPDFNALTAVNKRHPIYYVVPENVDLFKQHEIEVSGKLEDLLQEVDVIIDATPKNVGIFNKPLYEKAGVKAIFEGGEKADVAQCSFNTYCNYNEALNKDFIRVVSCNTTGLARTIGPLTKLGKLGKIRVVLIRRAADPVESKKGPINAIVPEFKVPSHHGPDLKTVLPGIDIVSVAVVVPTTIMHLHTVMIEVDGSFTRDDVIETFRKIPRIKLIDSNEGFASTAEIMEYARSLGRYMGDLYEIPVWKDTINIKDGELYYMQAVHQEAVVIPENIDAIRAIMGAEQDGEKSRKITDKSLGIDD
ncbi:MAG: type II glyceraldehyde-3-phosphate dehydrogenase [candidate division WOR-3 bacterium]|nr:type II glyceraldehyde-3-phosphate dehydrogenase [candidate division WOR-3 bacterium]